MRLLLIVLSAAALISGCQIVYKLPTRQGNVIEQKQLDQLRLGMNREQVEYLLGSPLVSDEFQPGRWDYVSYYRSGAGTEISRTVSLYFDGNILQRMQDSKPAPTPAAAENEEASAATES